MSSHLFPVFVWFFYLCAFHHSVSLSFFFFFFLNHHISSLAVCSIEHLTLPDVECFSEVVFGYMTPVAVIVSTPNVEFNPLLLGLTGFRHSDHKFEWTRAEFKSWYAGFKDLFSGFIEFSGQHRVLLLVKMTVTWNGNG